jgi:hypothetical protein
VGDRWSVGMKYNRYSVPSTGYGCQSGRPRHVVPSTQDPAWCLVLQYPVRPHSVPSTPVPQYPVLNPQYPVPSTPVPSPRHSVPGTPYSVPSTRCPAFGTQYPAPVPSTLNSVLGARNSVLRYPSPQSPVRRSARTRNSGTRYLVPSTRPSLLNAQPSVPRTPVPGTVPGKPYSVLGTPYSGTWYSVPQHPSARFPAFGTQYPVLRPRTP